MNLMSDLSVATAGLSAIKSGFGLAKELVDLLKQPDIDRAAIQTKLLELQQLILDAQASIGETAEENRQLRNALSQVENRKILEADMEMVPDGSFFVRRSERDKGAFIPYCPVCWGHEDKTVPLVVRDKEGLFECVIHHATFKTDAYLRALAAAENRMMAKVTRSAGGDPSQGWMR